MFYRRNCNNCNKYYEGHGQSYCSVKCKMKGNQIWLGKKHSEETKRKMAIAATKVFPTEYLTIIGLYKSGSTIKKLAEKYKVSFSTIWKILKNYGVEIVRRKYSANYKFFKTIDTEQKAYWLGFIMADGCVIKGKYSRLLDLTLKAEDRNHLQKFLDDINGNYRIEEEKNRYKVRIHSLDMILDLAKYGIVPRKAFVTKFPDRIPKKLWRHFIRGVFDGDGCLCVDKYGYVSFDIAGTKELLTRIQEILIDNCDLNKTKVRKQNNTYRFAYGGKYVIKILDYLYNNATVFLDRKHEKAQKVIHSCELDKSLLGAPHQKPTKKLN